MPTALEETPASRLRARVRLFVAWLWLIVLCSVVAGAGGYYLASRNPAVYAAAASLEITDPTLSNVFATDLQRAQGDVSRFVQTQIGVILSTRTSTAAAALLDPPTTAGGARAGVSAAAVPGSNVVVISARDGSPDRARQKANAFTNAYIEGLRTSTLDNLTAVSQQLNARIAETQAELSRIEADISRAQAEGRSPEEIRSLENRRSAAIDLISVYRGRLGQEQVNASVRDRSAALLSQAELPLVPVEPKPIRQGILGAFLGLLAGVGLVLLFDRLDDSLRDPQQAAWSLGIAELAAIPVVDRWRQASGIAMSEAPAAPESETFRILRTNLRFSALPRSARLIIVTSALPGEGKSTVASNLAWALAESGARVILVDGDLRKPGLHKLLDLDNAEGLTTAILGERVVFDVMRPTGVPASPATFRAITSGPVPPNPAELLALPRTRDLLNTLTAHADFVILDSAPVLPVSDGLVLSSYADAVVFVADSSRSSARSSALAIERLRRIDAALIGFVLNRVDARATAAYGYTYGTYGVATEGSPAPSTVSPSDCVDRERAAVHESIGGP